MLCLGAGGQRGLPAERCPRGANVGGGGKKAGRSRGDPAHSAPRLRRGTAPPELRSAPGGRREGREAALNSGGTDSARR